MNESLHHLILEYNQEWAKKQWPVTLYSVLCLVIGLLGNGYVLFVYKCKLQNTGESRYFIPYLATADLCTTFFSCIAFIVQNFHVLYFPWDFLCKGAIFAFWMPALASAFLLLAIAVQRYTKTNPSGRQSTLGWRRAAVAIIFIVALIDCIPFLVVSGVGEKSCEYKGFNLTGTKCRTKNDRYPTLQTVYSWYLIVILALNVSITFGFYIYIAVAVYKRQRIGKPESNQSKSSVNSAQENNGISQQDPESPKSTTKTTDAHSSNSIFESLVNCCRAMRKNRKSSGTASLTHFNVMFLTIWVVYLLSFLPTGIIFTIVNTDDLDNRKDIPQSTVHMYSILMQMYVINNIANPFIYGYFDMEFRKYLKSLLYCFLCRKK